MLQIEVVKSNAISDLLARQIVALCSAAYGEELTRYFCALTLGTHVLGYLDESLVTHAMFVTRWLQPGRKDALRTAYVELVATNPAHQRQGYASKVMQRLQQEIPARYDLAALCPVKPKLYEQLGWRYWRGPLGVRMPEGQCICTPDEKVMVCSLPQSPMLNFTEFLSVEWRPGELW